MTTGQTSTIYVGQLAVDMYDFKNHDFVWRGVASKTIDPESQARQATEEPGQGGNKTLENVSSTATESQLDRLCCSQSFSHFLSVLMVTI